MFVLKLFQKAILAWMPDPGTRDASIVRKAFIGDVIDLKAATEVICSRTPSQLQYIKQVYNSRFGTYLEHDIEYQAKGDHQKVHSLSQKLIFIIAYSFQNCI